jgi:hypothetical protein
MTTDLHGTTYVVVPFLFGDPGNITLEEFEVVDITP